MAPAATAHMVKPVFAYVVRIYCFNGENKQSIFDKKSKYIYLSTIYHKTMSLFSAIARMGMQMEFESKISTTHPEIAGKLLELRLTLPHCVKPIRVKRSNGTIEDDWKTTSNVRPVLRSSGAVQIAVEVRNDKTDVVKEVWYDELLELNPWLDIDSDK